MCDLGEGTFNSDLEGREVLLEEVTCKLRPEDKQVLKQGVQKGGRMVQGEGTACVRLWVPEVTAERKQNWFYSCPAPNIRFQKKILAVIRLHFSFINSEPE